MSATSSFCHCHVHTEYSMLDGASRVEEVVAAAAADGQPALGMTDHGNMYGALPFYKACTAAGIKPVIGTELYQAHDHRTERINTRGKVDDTGGEGDGGKKAYYHLIALAETNEGYKNLIQLSSRAFLEGYYRKPKVDWELLDSHSRGVIATTGCLGGHVLQSLLADRFDEALEKAGRLQDIFGRDNLFVELQDHGIDEQARTNPQLIDIAKRIGAPLLATNDSHYTLPEHAEAHDALLCVQTGALISQSREERFKFSGSGHYLRSATEMRHVFRDVEVACDNSLWIAERADVQIEFGKPQLPRFPLPEGFATDGDYLRHLTFEGARQRWSADGTPLPDAVTERLVYELKVIEDMGFSAYFLIVADLIRHARDHDIRVGPGRGSAAGCAVAYCLRITDLDPIKYDLLFERFLNPSRISMPDIDMDFDSRYRDEMIRYAAERYGRDRVAQIVTFSTIKARAAVRDAARVLGYPYIVGDKVAKAMPPLVMGRDTPLYACLEPHPKFADGYKMAADLRAMCDTDPDVARVVGVARGLEGLRRQDGIHAAAVVITRDPLTDYLPIQRKPEPGQDPELAPVVTQYEMNGVEELGLLKMDFLGLRNLDVISDTLCLIRDFRGPDAVPDIDAVPLDDDATLRLLCRGDSIGVFQLEGGPMRALMRSLAPSSFDDVAALVALYRPGPMAANMHNDYADRKNGRKPVQYLHPDAEELLASTYGLCLTGDTIVVDAVSGRPTRLDEVDVEQPGGFWVQGVDDDLRPAIRQVTHRVCNGERDVLELQLRNGMALRGTPDHPLLTERGWVQLGDLRDDDHVAVPPSLFEPVTPTSLDHARLRVLGHLLGDGSLTNGAAISFHNADAGVLDAFCAAVAAAFPRTRLLREPERDGCARVRAVASAGARRSDLLDWLRSVGLKAGPGGGTTSGGAGSAEKFVPPDVFGADALGVGVVLAALWDCDGYVGRDEAIYTTTSARLAADVQRLLLRLGIASSRYEQAYRRRRDGAPMTAHQVTVFDGARFSTLIGVHLTDGAKRSVVFDARATGGTLDRAAVAAAVVERWSGSVTALAERFGISRLHFQPGMVARRPRVQSRIVTDLLDDLDPEGLARHVRLRWVRVGAVEPAGRAQVYDITVDGIHNFVANGIVAHNCVYQEQVMRIAQKFAGFSLADADSLRKAMGKKKREVMQKEKEKFVAGCDAQGYGTQLGETWFGIIEQFADYAFNRSHSYGYGFIAYQTAYLKAHFPVEYLAALLTSVKTSLEKAAVYLAECRAMGIRVLVPDVNRSRSDFVPARLDDEGGTEVIPFGLSAVRNVGEGLVELILREREAKGPYRDFYDFCDRVDLQVLNKRTIESLIKAGAFDSFGHPRRGLLVAFEEIVDKTCARRREHDMGIMTLFGEAGGGADGASAYDDRPEVPDLEFDKRERLAFEKEMLGLYVSDHPLLGAEAALRRRTDGTLADAAEHDEGSIKSYGGVITSLQRKWTRAGDLMAVFTLEDLQGSMEVMVFPKTMAVVGHKLDDDAVVVVKGKVDRRDDQPKLVCMDVDVFDGITDGAPPVRIKVPLNASDHLVDRLRALISEHPGQSPVFLHVGQQVVRLADRNCVDASKGFMGEVRVLLGADCLV